VAFEIESPIRRGAHGDWPAASPVSAVASRFPRWEIGEWLG